MIMFWQVTTGLDQLPQPNGWRAWTNAKTEEKTLLIAMAAHRFVRERGGVLPKEELSVIVYWYWQGEAIIDKSGQPDKCNYTKYKVIPEEEEALCQQAG